MLVPARMRDLVHEHARETPEVEAGGGSDRDHDHSPLRLRAHVRAAACSTGSRHHEHVTEARHVHGPKTPGKERPEIFGVVA